MKIIILFFSILCSTILSAQTPPNLPVALGAGTAEVWNDSIYYFGGAEDFNGSLASLNVYKFDGVSWTLHDTIPDAAVWDMESVVLGDDVYLMSGWPGGSELLRKYHLPTGTWTYLSPSPNFRPWGCTAEVVDSLIYLFHPFGFVYQYNPATDNWQDKSNNSTTATFGLSSTVYQDEIYLVGYNDSTLQRYSPSQDNWTPLATMPQKLLSGVIAVLNNRIYYVGGGNDEDPDNPSDALLVYDPTLDNWQYDQFTMSARRQWITDVTYQNSLYVLGGFDTTRFALDIVEEILPLGPAVGILPTNLIPSGFKLEQNYPNPFNPSTTIAFTLPETRSVRVEIFNMLGQSIEVILDDNRSAGYHELRYDASELESGTYFYKLTSGDIQQTKKFILLK
ncbi:MAG: T9SS type A sorting domain-containing protein [Calditrichia bacterium]